MPPIMLGYLALVAEAAPPPGGPGQAAVLFWNNYNWVGYGYGPDPVTGRYGYSGPQIPGHDLAVCLYDAATNTWTFKGYVTALNMDPDRCGYSLFNQRHALRYCGDRLFCFVAPEFTGVDFFNEDYNGYDPDTGGFGLEHVRFSHLPNCAYSDDDGATWTAVHLPDDVHVADLQPGKTPGTIYATAARFPHHTDGHDDATGTDTYTLDEDPTALTGVYKSTDNGLTWARVWAGPPATGTFSRSGFPYVEYNKWANIAPDPDDASIVAVTSALGVHLTYDDFATMTDWMGPEQSNPGNGTAGSYPLYTLLARSKGHTIYNAMGSDAAGNDARYTRPDHFPAAIRSQPDPFPGGGEGAWLPLTDPVYESSAANNVLWLYNIADPGRLYLPGYYGYKILPPDAPGANPTHSTPRASTDGGVTWAELTELETWPDGRAEYAPGQGDFTAQPTGIVRLANGGLLGALERSDGPTDDPLGGDAWTIAYLAPGATRWTLAGVQSENTVIGVPGTDYWWWTAGDQYCGLAVKRPVAPAYQIIAVMYDSRVNGDGGLANANPYYFAIVARKPDGTWEVRAPHPLTNQQTFDHTDPHVRGMSSTVDSYWRGRGLCYLKHFGGRLFTWYNTGSDFAPIDGGNTASYSGMQMTEDTPAHYSDDLGVTWQELTLTGIREIDRLADGRLVAVALQGQGIFVSADNGDTWTRLAAFDRVPFTDYLWHTVAADPVAADTVALAAYEGYYVGDLAGGTTVGPMGPPMWGPSFSGAWRDGHYPPDQFSRSDWPIRAPGGAATVIRPDYGQWAFNGVSFPSRRYFVRQPDAGFASDGSFLGPITHDNAIQGYQQSRFYRDGATLYRCEVEAYWNSRTLADPDSYWIWRSTDDGATWQGVLHAADPVWVDPYSAGNDIAHGIGRIEATSGGTLYANADATSSGNSWSADFYTADGMAPSPRFVASADDGATWALADGTLIADTATAPDGTPIASLGSASDAPWFCTYLDGWAIVE